MTLEREEELKCFVQKYKNVARENNIGPIHLDDIMEWLECDGFTREEIDEAWDCDLLA